MKRRRAGQAGQGGHQPAPQAGGPPVRLIGGQYEIESRWPILALTFLTYLMMLPLFAPWSFWPLGYVVFVPWVAAACVARRTRWVYIASYLLGAAFFLTHWRWLALSTPEGYYAGSFYFALHFPMAIWPVRHLYRRRGLSVALTFAVAWTATELIRSRGTLGFPWFLLGHSQVRLVTMIQIADLAGVYGVTFVAAMVNGWLVDLLLRPILIWHGGRAWLPRVGPVGTVATVLSLGATVIYGRIQLAGGPGRDGPRVAVLQGDFILSPTYDPEAPTPRQKSGTYLALFDQAAAEEPDLVVFPETPWELMCLNRERVARSPRDAKWNDTFLRITAERRTHLVVGSISEEPQPPGTYPKEHRYNSAFVYAPGAREPDRYDKINLVMFGEYVPFRYNRWLHPVYEWLNGLTPWGQDGFEYSLTPGRELKTFPMQERAPGGSAFRFAVTICYEDAIPQGFRRFVVDSAGRKRVDFMLNISNDGWFGHGPQQPQHLVACAFRAVENRVGIARAVNTGVSGFVDSTGSWRDLVGESQRAPQAGGQGYRVARVRVDPRVTLYSRYGDVFGWACCVVMLASVADAVVVGIRGRRTSRRSVRQGAVG